MKRPFRQMALRLLLAWSALARGASIASAQAQPNQGTGVNLPMAATSDVVEQIDRLVEQNKQLESQNKNLSYTWVGHQSSESTEIRGILVPE
jgi:hypothetical protein